MKETQFSWFQFLLGVLLAAAGIASPSAILRWLGWMTLLFIVLMGWNYWRSNKDEPRDLSLRTPELSLLERWFPWFFFALASAVVLALFIYTLQQIGII